mgnify:CR=1 FL=1
MLYLSELWAEALALYYDGQVRYSHINNNGMWEFSIETYMGTMYTSKGLRNNGKN